MLSEPSIRSWLSLPLLMVRVLADNQHLTLAANYLALFAHRFDRRPYLHDSVPLISVHSLDTDGPPRLPPGRPSARISGLLLEPVRDPAAREVVRRKLDLHPVSRQNPDIVHPHLARDVGQDFVIVVQLHPKHRVREGFDHHSF